MLRILNSTVWEAQRSVLYEFQRISPESAEDINQITCQTRCAIILLLPRERTHREEEPAWKKDQKWTRIPKYKIRRKNARPRKYVFIAETFAALFNILAPRFRMRNRAKVYPTTKRKVVLFNAKGKKKFFSVRV